MFISKRHLDRRTFLRGTGVCVALPLLESMVPAQTPIARTAAASKSRLSCIYVPHGATMDLPVIRRSWSACPQKGTPWSVS